MVQQRYLKKSILILPLHIYDIEYYFFIRFFISKINEKLYNISKPVADHIK